MKQVVLANRSWYKTILEMMPEPAMIWRKRGIRRHVGDVIYANKAMLTLTGGGKVHRLGERIKLQRAQKNKREGQLAIQLTDGHGAHEAALKLCLNDGTILSGSMRSSLIIIDNKPCMLSIITLME